MCIKINNYNDLKKLSDIDLEIDYLSEEVENIGKIPGYYYYINLIRYRDKLYLMITKDYKKMLYFRCVFDLNVYKSIVMEFGFILDGRNKFFTKPEDFNEYKEKRLIEKLLNLNSRKNYMEQKYGLK